MWRSLVQAHTWIEALCSVPHPESYREGGQGEAPVELVGQIGIGWIRAQTANFADWSFSPGTPAHWHGFHGERGVEDIPWHTLPTVHGRSESEEAVIS